jgi:hypothetical protein
VYAKLFSRGAQADAYGAAQILDRGAQAAARDADGCASQLFDRCTQAAARGT